MFGEKFFISETNKIYKMRSNEKLIFVVDITSSFWGMNLGGKPRNYWIQPNHTLHLLCYSFVPMHEMKIYGEVREERHSFLTQARDVGAWSTSRPCRFLSGESVSVSRWRGSWVGPELVWPLWSRENLLPRRESKHNSSVFQPVTVTTPTELPLSLHSHTLNPF